MSENTNQEPAAQETAADVSEEYLAAGRQAIRTKSTAFDGEIVDLIRAARADLALGDIRPERIMDEEDPLIKRAIMSYIKEVSTDFSRIVPGAAVWLPGHIGVYIGDGLAVECTPKWRNKVQVTAVSNIGAKAGYNARKWTKWGKIPYISYEEEIENMSKEELKALIRETVKEVLDEENPVYKDLKDVPEYWKPTAAALLEAGAVNGGTPAEVCETDLNLRKETLKAVVVAAMYHDAQEGKR